MGCTFSPLRAAPRAQLPPASRDTAVHVLPCRPRASSWGSATPSSKKTSRPKPRVGPDAAPSTSSSPSTCWRCAGVAPLSRSQAGKQRHNAAASCLALHEAQGAARRPEARSPGITVMLTPAIGFFPASAKLDWRESLATCYSQAQLLNLPYDSPVMTGPRLPLPEVQQPQCSPAAQSR